MVIVYGVGERGKKCIEKKVEKKEVFVIYDNDRRKWGKRVSGKEIIDLSTFLFLIEKEACEIICTIRNPNALYFLKDTIGKLGLKHKVYNYEEDGSVEEVNLDQIPPFFVNFEKLHENSMKTFGENAEYFRQMGNMKAYHHALEYIERKDKMPLAPELYGLELTNYCNLACPNCPNSTCKREKGYVSETTFKEILKNIPPRRDNYFSVHGLGEPLMHPNFLEYLEQIVERGIIPVVSTNGLLLDDDMINRMLTILNMGEKSRVLISFHTRKSVEAWVRSMKWIEQHGGTIEMFGTILEHNEEDAECWLRECGIEDIKNNKNIRKVTSHSFAGNVAGRRSVYCDVETANRHRNCYYINRNLTDVAWDGRLKACCLDAEVSGEVGTIHDIENARINQNGYLLCHTCDPDWTSDFQ